MATEERPGAAGAEADASWFSVAGCAHGGYRAEACGVEGEGTAIVEHDDGRGIRAVPPFVEAYTKITRKLGCLIVDLARFMTLSDIAGWLRLSWDTVKAVVKGRLEKDYRRIGYRRVRQIAIDELYLGRTRKYITLVMDMESARSSGWGKAAGRGSA